MIDVQKPSIPYSTERRKKNHRTEAKKKRRETTIEEGDFVRFQTIAVTATKEGQNSKPTNQRKMKASLGLVVLLATTICIGELAVSVRLGNQVADTTLSLEGIENSMGEIKGEGDVVLPKIPEGSALQRCRFKCDNLAFLPKDMAGNVSSEHCYLGCLWFSELGCTPLPPAVPHINQPLLDQPPAPPKAATAGTGSTGATGATGMTGNSKEDDGPKAQLLKATEKLLKKTQIETKKAEKNLLNDANAATGATGAN